MLVKRLHVYSRKITNNDGRTHGVDHAYDGKFSSNLENAPIASPSKKKKKSKAKGKNSVANTTRAHRQEPLLEPPSNTIQSIHLFLIILLYMLLNVISFFRLICVVFYSISIFG